LTAPFSKRERGGLSAGPLPRTMHVNQRLYDNLNGDPSVCFGSKLMVRSLQLDT